MGRSTSRSPGTTTWRRSTPCCAGRSAARPYSVSTDLRSPLAVGPRVVIALLCPREDRVVDADHRVDVVLVEELDPVGRLAVVGFGAQVAGAADELHNLVLVAHHRVGPRLVGQDDRDGELGAGLLG